MYGCFVFRNKYTCARLLCVCTSVLGPSGPQVLELSLYNRDLALLGAVSPGPGEGHPSRLVSAGEHTSQLGSATPAGLPLC